MQSIFSLEFQIRQSLNQVSSHWTSALVHFGNRHTKSITKIAEVIWQGVTLSSELGEQIHWVSHLVTVGLAFSQTLQGRSVTFVCKRKDTFKGQGF